MRNWLLKRKSKTRVVEPVDVEKNTGEMNITASVAVALCFVHRMMDERLPAGSQEHFVFSETVSGASPRLVKILPRTTSEWRDGYRERTIAFCLRGDKVDTTIFYVELVQYRSHGVSTPWRVVRASYNRWLAEAGRFVEYFVPIPDATGKFDPDLYGDAEQIPQPYWGYWD